MSFAGERFQINICNTSYFDIVQYKLALQMDLACLVFKVSLAQICGLSIESYPQFGAALSLCKFDMYIPKIDPVLESLHRLFRPQATLHRMPPFAQSTH